MLRLWGGSSSCLVLSFLLGDTWRIVLPSLCHRGHYGERCFKAQRLFFLIGVQLFYNVVLVSIVQRSEVEFPVLYGRFSLVIYFIHISVYMLVPISQFIPVPPFPPWRSHQFEWNSQPLSNPRIFVTECVLPLHAFIHLTVSSKTLNLPNLFIYSSNIH